LWRAFSDAAEPDLFDKVSELADNIVSCQRRLGKGDDHVVSPPLALSGSFMLLLAIKVLCEDKLLAAIQRWVPVKLICCIFPWEFTGLGTLDFDYFGMFSCMTLLHLHS
jgi:hypothetical protein